MLQEIVYEYGALWYCPRRAALEAQGRPCPEVAPKTDSQFDSHRVEHCRTKADKIVSEHSINLTLYYLVNISGQ
jgi:hypothetical protein